MTDIIIGILCTLGALTILIAAVGILRMPDFYLRLSVTVKAATLGGGLLLSAAAVYFTDEVSVTTKALAIIFFLILTGPVAAHLIGRTAYVIGTEQWKGTIRDDLTGMYHKDSTEPGSGENAEENGGHEVPPAS
ncbi:multicomponent Na+:H+ antiporter subunit G [Parapedobacter composti]|uniref:Multicomponent Na+:H+ antiporter subunit G n=1 Tax=Parapedobacter composti TaxID=623281 RepID=A0A1I1F5J0_9SPHI|nr:monovalent cation/H(+) antiporter subunit G [Parapedobacter composti]SFB92413.1 multicomponent Na+:H+ antiporter subunit G [Parapedobacter composti]